MTEKKSMLPVRIQTILAGSFILNSIWLIAKLANFAVPLGDSQAIQTLSVWIAAFGSLYGGIHILMIKFRHKAVKSLL